MEISVNGCSIYYDVRGSGPPLLIPGWASSSRFEENIWLFGDEYTIISLDVRGTGGRTMPPPGPYGVEDMADDAAEVLKVLGFERAHYIGLSHTGVIGQVMAVRHPEMIDRLVLTMTTPGSEPKASSGESRSDDISHDLSVSADLADSMKAALAGDRAALRRNAELCLAPSFAQSHPDIVERTVEEYFIPIFTQPTEDYFRFWKALTEIPSASRLEEIGSPTLIVTGSEDRMVELSDSWRLWQRIPNSVLVGLNDVGHDWYPQAPQLVAGIIKSFLRGEMDVKG